MKRLNILWIGLISVLMTACYDDYEKDYDKSSVYFASQKPLRTLVADRKSTRLNSSHRT